MAEPTDSSLAFFSKATPNQWRFVYELRHDAIQLKADQRSAKKGGPEEFIRLDKWYVRTMFIHDLTMSCDNSFLSFAKFGAKVTKNKQFK